MVVARNMWKHYGGASLPVLRKHYQGLRELMAWFARHADKQDGLLPPLSCTEQACGACYGDWMGFDPEAHNSGSSALTPQSSLLLGGGGGGLRSAERRAVLYRALSPTGPSPVSPLPPPTLIVLERGGGGACAHGTGHAAVPSFFVRVFPGVTAFYHVLATQYMSTIASALGKAADSAKWAASHSALLKVYHARYFNATAGGYSPCVGDRPPAAMSSHNPKQPMSARSCHGTSSAGSQTSNAMALALGAPPSDELAQTVADSLAADVRGFGNKTTAGVTGLAWLLPQLEQHGHGELALAILEGDEYPSVGHMAAQNMTQLPGKRNPDPGNPGAVPRKWGASDPCLVAPPPDNFTQGMLRRVQKRLSAPQTLEPRTLCENWACTFHDAGGGSGNHIMLGGFDP